MKAVEGLEGHKESFETAKQHNCFAIQSGVILHIIYGYFIQPPDCQDVFNLARPCDHDITEKRESESFQSGMARAVRGRSFRQTQRLFFPLLSPSPSLSGTNNSTVAEALKKQSAEYPRVMSVAG